MKSKQQTTETKFASAGVSAPQTRMMALSAEEVAAAADTPAAAEGLRKMSHVRAYKRNGLA